jgi:capsular exopolysaccharide synthesis family protein
MAAHDDEFRDTATDLLPQRGRHDLAERGGSGGIVSRSASGEVVLPAEGGEESSIDLMAVARRRKWWIIGLTLLGVVASIVMYTQLEEQFKSQARVLIRDRAPTLMAAPGTMSDRRNYLGTEMAFIMSNAVIGQASQRPGISELPSVQAAGPDASPAGVLFSMVNVEEMTPEIVMISATGKTPEETRMVVREVISVYRNVAAAASETQARKLQTMLESERVQTEQEVEEIWSQITELSRELGALPGDERRGNLLMARLGELQDALNNASLQVLELRQKRDLLREAEGDTALLRILLPESGDASASLWAQHQNLNRALVEYSFNYGDEAKPVQQLKNQIQVLEAELQDIDAQALETAMKAVELEFQAAERKYEMLLEEYKAQEDLAIDSNEQATRLQKLRSDLAARNRFLETADEGIKSLGFNVDAEPLRIEPIDEPGPGFKVYPKPSQIVGMGLVLGLMAGAGMAFLLEFADARLRDASEVEPLLELPVLGVMAGMGKRLSIVERALHVVRKPDSQVSEALRDIRTVLLYEMPGLNKRGTQGVGLVPTADAPTAGQVLLVTSPLPGDGKTTVASNLAASFAANGRRTLLIDADCRRPSIAKYLELDGVDPKTRVGFSGLLCEDNPPPLDEVIIRGPVADGPEEMDVLPSGEVPSNPAEMLNSDAARDLLDELRGRYDVIVVDSPPVLPVTDARILADQADGVVLVVRVNQTPRRAAVQAREALSRVGGPLVGTVVNDSARIKLGSGSKYGYGGYYSYRYAYTRDASQDNGDTNGQRRRFIPSRTTSINGNGSHDNGSRLNGNGQHD